MSTEPIILPSAYKHGVEANDMLHAYRNALYIHGEADDLLMFIGPNRTGVSILEIGVVQARFGGSAIVHAMPARPKYL